jgi:hypothetical protein
VLESTAGCAKGGAALYEGAAEAVPAMGAEAWTATHRGCEAAATRVGEEAKPSRQLRRCSHCLEKEEELLVLLRRGGCQMVVVLARRRPASTGP